MPDAIPDLKVVSSAAVGFVDVQGSDVEDNLLSVSGSDAPLALLTLRRRRGIRVFGRPKSTRILLVSSPAFLDK